MPTNIEIKAFVRHWSQTCQRASDLSYSPVEVIEQEDTLFTCSQGRLKLRQFSSEYGELIAYRRQNKRGAKPSQYLITTTSEPSALCAVLSNALDVVGTVKKQRHLYLHGQTVFILIKSTVWETFSSWKL